MIVQCPECRTKFKLADEKVTPKGVKIRCSSCKHVFVVRREDGAEQEAPPPVPAKGGSSSFSVDDFGSGVDSSDVFNDSEFTDGPLGQTRPPEAGANSRPDRPIRPGVGEAPPPRPPVKPVVQDNVFNIDNVDFSVGRQMKVDLGADAPAPAPKAKPRKSPPPAGDPFSEGKGQFDNLDELFGPKKGAAPAPTPPKTPRASASLTSPDGGDPFGDSMTLNTAAKEKASVPAGSDGDPFGDLFGGDAKPKATREEEPSMQSMLTNESETDDSAFGDNAEPENSDDDFDSLITDTDDFFAGNKQAAADKPGHVDEDVYDPAATRREPAMQWGNQKKTQNVAPPSVTPKIIGGVVALLLLVIGWRASVEYMPQLYLDSGMEYEQVVALRGLIPFPASADFPPPPKFWDLTISKSFTIVNQFGKELYVVEGQIKNIGQRPRSFFQIQGQAVSASDKEIGLPETVFAGNILDVEALKRLPVVQVRTKLQLKLGAGGVNIEVKRGASIPFMMVFPELAEKASNVHIIQVQADIAGR